MSKDTLTIGGMLVTGILGLAGLMLYQSGNISELRTEVRTDIAELRMEMHNEIGELRTDMRTDIKAQSTQIKELQQRVVRIEGRVARIEGLLEGLRPRLATAPAT